MFMCHPWSCGWAQYNRVEIQLILKLICYWDQNLLRSNSFILEAMQWEKAQRTVKLLLNVWPTLLNNNHYTPKGNPFMTQHTQYYTTLAMAQYRKLKVYQTAIKLSANFLWLSKKKKKATTSDWREHLSTSFGQNLQKVSANPQHGVKAWCAERGRQRREFTARQHWPGDPEADLRTKICGLSVHMVTGVCRISNPIQPASLFSITISVKKKGAVHSHSHGAKLKTDSQLASMLDILKCQMYACNTCTLVDSYHLQLSEHLIRWKPVNKSAIISKLTSHNSVFISLS